MPLIVRFLTFAVAVGAAVSQTYSGKVVAVTDGDTIRVLHDRREQRIRVYGVDFPESKQAFGTRARQFTADLVFAKAVRVESLGTDRYGRTIGRVTLPDGRSLQAELVRAGLAWWYRQYAPKDAVLEKLEAEARRAGRGLWVDPNPIPPWEFRKARTREKRESARR
jgi:endonuclease YncB( thermonuclease family)